MSNEKKYMKATTTIARELIDIAREDAADKTAWRPEFEEVLDDYKGDFLQQLNDEIKRLLEEGR